MTKARKPAKKLKGGQNKATAEQRHKLFVEAYLSNNGNGTEAALAAGFSPKSAASQASRLLKSVKVKQELDSRRAEVATKVGLTTERTLLEIARLAYSDPRRLYHPDGRLKSVHELDDDTAATVSSVEVDEITAGENVIGSTKKIKHWDKRAALDMAMKFHGLYERDNEQVGRSLGDRLQRAMEAAAK